MADRAVCPGPPADRAARFAACHVIPSPSSALALGVAFLAGCGGGAAKSQTKRITLFTGPIKVFQSDVGPRGSSRGDVRTFTRSLRTESGRPAGRLDGTTAITDEVRRGGKVREYRVGTVHYTLTGGTVAIGGVYVSTPNSSVPVSEGARRPILGGTGVYRGAKGEVVQTPLPGGRTKDVLDIDLPPR